MGDKKKMIELGTLLKKTEWGAIFPGPGLVYSLQGNMAVSYTHLTLPTIYPV